MNGRMRFTIGSDPSEEDLVADLICDDETWGAITRRANDYVLILYPKRQGAWSLPVDEALALVHRAQQRLVELERTEE